MQYQIIITTLLAYIIGSIPWGFLIGKFNKLDIREHGSKNIGATNITRVLGKDWGVFCFLLDMGKGIGSVYLAHLICENTIYVPILATAAVVGGHIYPFTLKFKGGKGVATSLGAVIGLAFIPVIIAFAVWVILFYTFRYVSLASIIAAITLPVIATILSKTTNLTYDLPVIILLFALATLVAVKHKTNIARLLNGSELKFDKKTKTTKIDK